MSPLQQLETAYHQPGPRPPEPLTVCGPFDIPPPPPEPPYQPWLRGLPIVSIESEKPEVLLRTRSRRTLPLERLLVLRGCVFPLMYGPAPLDWQPRPKKVVKLRVVRTTGRIAPETQHALEQAGVGECGDADIGPAIARPRYRHECANVPRPCPFVSCRHHNYLDVTEAGSLRLNFPGLDVADMKESCSLDVAERFAEKDETGSLTQVAEYLNLSHERVRQIERDAKAKIAAHEAEHRRMVSFRQSKTPTP
jgi:hypothetical protein